MRLSLIHILYAVFESATVYDHSMCQNSQMNLKIHPTAVKGLTGTRKLLDVIRAYMRKGGFHVQFNIVGSDTLRAAQKKPESYRDLMVRVAGFTPVSYTHLDVYKRQVLHRQY